MSTVKLRNLSAEFDTPRIDNSSRNSPTTRTRIRNHFSKPTYSDSLLPKISRYSPLCRFSGTEPSNSLLEIYDQAQHSRGPEVNALGYYHRRQQGPNPKS